MTVILRPTRADELEILDAMDRQDHANQYVIQTGIEQHRKNFNDPDITYLCIENSRGELCGYFILVIEAGGKSVEFRRILIDRDRRGIGQTAITEMETYCQRQWQLDRIWLDVYEDNEIGRHIYQKMGYVPAGETCFEGRKLLFFAKTFEHSAESYRAG